MYVKFYTLNPHQNAVIYTQTFLSISCGIVGLQLQKLHTNFKEVCKIPAHIREFEKPKGRGGCFCDVFWMNWNLTVCFHQIYCGEDSPASRLLCKVGNVPNGLLVGDGSSVQWTIVATGFPAVFFLGDDVEGRSPRAIGVPSVAGCRFGASPRNWISRFGGGLVLAAVDAKLQEVQAWCEDINSLKPAYVLHVNTESALLPAIPSSTTTRAGRRVRFPEYLRVQQSQQGVVCWTPLTSPPT